MPAYVALGSERTEEDCEEGLGWAELFANDEAAVEGKDRLGVSLVCAQCLHGLFDSEQAVRAAAARALENFVAHLSDQGRQDRLGLLETWLLPGLRMALRARIEGVRRAALSVVQSIVRRLSSQPSCEGLPLVDLQPLLNDEDPEVTNAGVLLNTVK